MPVHLDRDLKTLKKNILNLGGKVEDAIKKAINALVDRRPELADEVVNGDSEIDSDEVEIEEKCMKVLALHQPVASDLRFIITALKVNSVLERMGDQAANIALRARFLSDEDPIDIPIDLTDMVDQVKKMVEKSLESLVNQDPELAREVSDMDDEVNDAHQRMFQGIQELMADKPETIERAIHTLLVSRYLERIGDLTKNIAEDVIFLSEGKVLRHQLADSGELDLT